MASWSKYHIRITRLVEEQAYIYVTAKDEEAAQEKALEEAADVASLNWVRSDAEPENYTAEVTHDMKDKVP